ncbi:MAG: ABC transporter permease [Firmicutes bacterium]|nr:ABC transporter permease [Bacillota bacterium]
MIISAPAEVPRRRSPSRGVAGIFLSRPIRVVGLMILVLYLFMAILGPVVFPPSVALVANPAKIYQGPTWSDPLGTDFQGVSVLAEIVLGARGVLMVGVGAAFFIVIIGVGMGLMAGFTGGFVDAVLMRITDVFIAIPQFPLLLLVATILNASSPWLIILMLSLTSWGGLARAVRSQTLSLRERDFVEAARGLRLGTRLMTTRVILPNMLSYVAMNFMVSITGAIYAEVGLLFLGITPFTPDNWGVMLHEADGVSGALYTSSSILYVLSPMIAILLLQAGIIFVLGALDEVFNPRLRTGATR